MAASIEEITESTTNLSRITIRDSITRIGSDAFLGCTSLFSITMPNSGRPTTPTALNTPSPATVTPTQENPPAYNAISFDGHRFFEAQQQDNPPSYDSLSFGS